MNFSQADVDVDVVNIMLLTGSITYIFNSVVLFSLFQIYIHYILNYFFL